MAKLVHTWYVSFRPHKRIPANSYCRRMARSFPNEAEAKNYTRSQIAQGQHDITAGTLKSPLAEEDDPPVAGNPVANGARRGAGSTN